MSKSTKGIHIAAGGFEYDRIMVPIMTEYPVEKLILLQDDTSEEYPGASKITEHFVEEIMDNPIPVDIEEVDIYDFDKVFQKTLALIRKYTSQDKLVYLNVSSAPKLALVAMMTAAYFVPDRSNVRIFYGAPEDYVFPKLITELGLFNQSREKESKIEKMEELGEEFLQKGSGVGVKEYEEIPVFPLQEINDLDSNIMKILKEHEGVESIKELIQALEDEEGVEIKRSSLQYRMEKLEKMNLIDRDPDTVRVKVKLTRTGEIYLNSEVKQ